MTISQTSPTALALEVALATPRASKSGKTQLAASDRAKAFVNLPDGTRREVTVQVNIYFKE